MKTISLNFKLNPLFRNNLEARARRICSAGPAFPVNPHGVRPSRAQQPPITKRGLNVSTGADISPLLCPRTGALQFRDPSPKAPLWGILTTCLLGLLLPAWGQDPWLTNTNNPVDTNVSVGATVRLQLSATSTNLPMTYQWQHEGTNLPAATNNSLTLTNLSIADAGGYMAWITNASGGFTNTRSAMLTVDSTFTKIMTGPGGTDSKASAGAAWGDYDGDGLPDLVIANGHSGGIAFWHNNGNGTFTKITTNRPALDGGDFAYPYWIDYDNDGDLDLHLLASPSSSQPDRFYRNDGNGLFTSVTPEFVKTVPYGVSDGELCSWADFNNDGSLDVFIPRNTRNDLFFRGTPGGLFQSMTTNDVGAVVGAATYSVSATFDYDNDGWLDLLTGWEGAYRLYHNEGYGFFVQVIGSPLNNNHYVWNFAVGDYNNDGKLDLYAPAAEDGYRGRLYRNDGNGSFTNVAAAAGVDRPLNALFATWADYDNDGHLDLLITTGAGYNPPQNYGSTNVLFHNNGDGTFTSVEIGSPLRDGLRRYAPTWVDYDHDGFLDFFIACGNGVAERNYLYRNNLPTTGNTNRWLNVRLVGKASNSKGVGAKVRAMATFGGKTGSQLREITVPGSVTQEDYLAHFGLGDATNVTTLRIEWPSGIVQEQTNVAANQFLTVVECQNYTGTCPAFTGATMGASGAQLSVTEPAAGTCYLLEASSDLVNWTKQQVRTSTGGTSQFTDTSATNYPSRYYRLQVP